MYSQLSANIQNIFKYCHTMSFEEDILRHITTKSFLYPNKDVKFDQHGDNNNKSMTNCTDMRNLNLIGDEYFFRLFLSFFCVRLQ